MLTNEDKIEHVRLISSKMSDPFRRFLSCLTDDTPIKQIELDDFVPPTGLHESKRVILVGDAFHAMTMCKPRIHGVCLMCMFG